MPAAAERNHGTSAEAEFLAILIHNREVAFDTQWAVIQHYDFCASQGFLRLQNT